MCFVIRIKYTGFPKSDIGNFAAGYANVSAKYQYINLNELSWKNNSVHNSTGYSYHIAFIRVRD